MSWTAGASKRTGGSLPRCAVAPALAPSQTPCSSSPKYCIVWCQCKLPSYLVNTSRTSRPETAASPPGIELVKLARVDADTAGRAALVGSEREPQHVDGLFAAPVHRPFPAAQVADPMSPGVAEAVPPVIVQGM